MCRRHVDEQHAEERLQTAFSEVEDVRKEKEEVERRLRRFVFLAHQPLIWNIDPVMASVHLGCIEGVGKEGACPVGRS